MLGDRVLIDGDGAGVTTERGDSEFLLFDVADTSPRPLTCTTDRHDDQHD
jgi:hypothetical protein